MNITTILRLLVLALSLAATRGPAAVLISGKTSQAGGTPPVIDAQPIARAVTVSGHVTLSVIAHASAPMSYQWSRNGQPLTNDARLTGATNLVLNIDPVLTNDTGSYSAVVTSSGGSATSAVAGVTINLLSLQVTVVPGQGVILKTAGQVGDVYRMESANNTSGPWSTNGYATNFSGTASLFLPFAGLGNFLRTGFDRFLPVMYRLDPTNGTAGFRAYGKLGQVWRCDTSSALPTWTSLGTVSNATGWVTFYDPRLPLPPVRFYRISPP